MFHLVTRVGVGLMAVLASGGAPALANAAPLSEHAWTHRPVLLFAPSRADERLQHTLGQLHARRCEVQDRDMVVGVFVTEGSSELAGQAVSASAAAALRERFDLNPDQFAALLIGKDGGEKYRLYESPELDEIFALIDGMPMRQEEMMQSPADCAKPQS